MLKFTELKYLQLVTIHKKISNWFICYTILIIYCRHVFISTENKWLYVVTSMYV